MTEYTNFYILDTLEERDLLKLSIQSVKWLGELKRAQKRAGFPEYLKEWKTEFQRQMQGLEFSWLAKVTVTFTD